MNLRENVRAILQYQPYDHMPVLHFGYWSETLEKWKQEGHITEHELSQFYLGSPSYRALEKRLGFDGNWGESEHSPNTGLFPCFEQRVMETRPDGSEVVFSAEGTLLLMKPGVVSIPPEIGHTLVDRASWEKEYLPRLQWTPERMNMAALNDLKRQGAARETLACLHAGSLMGNIRNWLGVEELSYLPMDDPDLFREIVDTVAGLCYRCTEAALEVYDDFDYLHFWEDICFKNGPLVTPSLFREIVGPHYHRLAELAASHGIGVVSLDCDGLIDRLLPIWLENGVNTMFPIEVGTWEASIAPWRETYGRELRGVGGMDKRVFAQDYAAVDAEIERLKPLMALGGYIPCPDHRIPPDAKFENVQYYCDRMQQLGR